MFLEHSGFDPDNALAQAMRKIVGGGWVGIVTRGFGTVLEEIASVEVK
jgi:hypothetical protein